MNLNIIIIIIGIYVVYKIAIFVYRLNTPKITGAKGESYVARILKRLNKKDYKVYNDIYLRKNDRTTQIDHLVLSIYGVFVIETKTYKGWIFGNENSKYWTQTLYKNKYQIFNPIKQNWTHINFLKNISFEFKDLQFFPIIVFAGNAKLKKINSSVPVIYRRKLLRTIKKNNDVNLTYDQLEKIDNLIKQAIITGREIRGEHRKYVKNNIKRNKVNTKPNICPKCGGKLIIKNGKYGNFYGCSNFPKCNFSQNK